LTEGELAWLWVALENFPEPFGPLFQVLLLTGQRRSEVAGMRWDEVRGLGTAEPLWDLPGHRTKNGQPHLIPLAPAVKDILLERRRTSALVFTTTNSTAVSGFSKAKSLLDARITELLRNSDHPSLIPWTLHDLRRTMVTVMNERLGIQPHVVEAVVNHTSGIAKRGVAGVYNRALYLDDRRNALLAWSGYLNTLTKPAYLSSAA
jgi:integrase